MKNVTRKDIERNADHWRRVIASMTFDSTHTARMTRAIDRLADDAGIPREAAGVVMETLLREGRY